MGYELDRFRDTSIDEVFLCPICNNVLKDPLLIQSCEHLFCGQCIGGKDKCPVDQKVFHQDQLKGPIRSFRNILNQFEISCEFASDGCKQYLKLDQIEGHLQTCEFRTTQICSEIDCICGQKILEKQLKEHQSNCLIHLKEELKQLRHSLNELTNNRNVETITGTTNGLKTISEEWISCKKQIKVLFSDMSEQQKADLISQLESGLNGNSEDFLKTITKYLEHKDGDVWFALMYESTGPYNYAKGNYLLVLIGQKRIRIFKSLKFSVLETIKEAQSVAQPIVMKNTMKLLMSDDAMLFSSRAISLHDDFLDIASLVRQRFTEKYGKNWNCILSADSFGLSYTPKEQTAINLRFGQMVLIIWQCP